MQESARAILMTADGSVLLMQLRGALGLLWRSRAQRRSSCPKKIAELLRALREHGAPPSPIDVTDA